LIYLEKDTNKIKLFFTLRRQFDAPTKIMFWQEIYYVFLAKHKIIAILLWHWQLFNDPNARLLG